MLFLLKAQSWYEGKIETGGEMRISPLQFSYPLALDLILTFAFRSQILHILSQITVITFNFKLNLPLAPHTHTNNLLLHTISVSHPCSHSFRSLARLLSHFLSLLEMT